MNSDPFLQPLSFPANLPNKIKTAVVCFSSMIYASILVPETPKDIWAHSRCRLRSRKHNNETASGKSEGALVILTWVVRSEFALFFFGLTLGL